MRNKPWFQSVGLIGAYAFVIGVITVMRKFFSPDFIIPLAAFLMFGVPFVMKGEVRGLRWNTYGVLLGIAVSVVVLSLYLIIMDKPVRFGRVSYSLLIFQLFFVALPEEVFFRGYLQEKIGNDFKGILIVSFLFALGHLITRCLGGGYGGGVCIQDLLTFFPSIVMGFLYAVSGTLWGNIIFHFLANVIYKATGGL
jgi:membrane protease YdiL (CAAX protease family)